MRERNADAIFGKRVPQGQVDVPANVGQAARWIADPEPQDVVDRTVAKPHDMTDSRARSQHAVHALRRSNRQFADLVRAVAVGGAEINIEADKVVGMGPVDHLACDQILVWDQVFFAVAGDHGHVTRTKRIDPAKRIPERDYVAGFDGFIEQDNHTRHKVLHHLLQTKAKADTNRT